MMSDRKKFLVIRYKFIGDTVLLIPFLRNLRANEPDAQIDVTVTNLTYPILKKCPYIDNFIFMNTEKKADSYELQDMGHDFKTIIKKNKYTHAFVLKRSISAAWLAFVCGIPKRIGFDTDFRSFLLTKKVPYNTSIHESQAFLDVLRTQNYQLDSGYPELFLDENVNEKVENLMAQRGVFDNNFVIIHATSGNHHKLWDFGRWSEVLSYLSNERKCRVVFSGAPNDKGIYEKIESACPDLKIKPINFCGELTLEESMALIGKARLLVGCDSGNLHIASALGVPVIGIYGPMSVDKWGALGENNTLLHSNEKCYPCSLKKECKNKYKCLSSITTQQVIDAIDKYEI